MPLGGLIAAAGAPIVGGVVGSIASSGDKDSARAAQAQALAAMQGLSPPDAAQLQVDLQRYQLTGEVTPALQSVINLQDTQMKNISVDPRLQQAQMGALQKLQQVGAGGLQPQDLAALYQTQQQAAGMGQSQQASALQAMQQRGIGGGGSELAARLSASQGAANQAMNSGLDIQSQAAQRALQAIAQSGQLGSQMQAQDFSQQAQIANAQDEINRFNAANSQQVQGQNVGAQNQAQYYNVGQKQQIANLNTQTAQDQAIRNAAAQQQAYQNQVQKASGLSNAYNNNSQQSMQNAAQTQQTWNTLGQGVGQGAQGIANYAQGQQKMTADKDMNQQWLKAYSARNSSNTSLPDVPSVENSYKMPNT